MNNVKLLRSIYQLNGAIEALKEISKLKHVQQQLKTLKMQKNNWKKSWIMNVENLIEQWPEVIKKYNSDFFEYEVRDKVIKQSLTTISLSGTHIPKVVLPKYKDWGDLLQWQLQENIPGEFPYTAGVFELKREGEDPTRMFAGEGGPERTNKRFHYVSWATCKTFFNCF